MTTTVAPPDLAHALAEHAATTPAEAIPAGVTAHLQRDLVDGLGVILGGLHAPGVPETRAVIEGWSAPGVATVFGTPLRLPPVFAAMANATAGHALDFDDTLDEGGGMHAGVPVHSAALAIADERGGVSGREYLAAVAVGLDVAVRLALAPHEDYGWHRTSAFGVFGVTVAAGRLLGLDVEQMRNALGIAYSQASGNRQCIADGALSKRLQSGFGARDGITAVLLAQRGLTGATNVFEGSNGFFPLYQRGLYSRETVADGLGREILSTRISLKPYPCGRNLHALADCALEIREEAGAEGITGVEIEAGGRAPARSGFPQDVVQAQFSAPFAVALALAEGRLTIRAFDRPQEASEAVRRLFALTEQRPHPDDGVRVTVRYADGRTVMRTATVASGNPARPMSDAQLRAKAHDCNAAAGQPLTAATLDRVIETALDLERLPDVKQLTALLATS
jgi:2-methylcitrate dehydratase PrpD